MSQTDADPTDDAQSQTDDDGRTLADELAAVRERVDELTADEVAEMEDLTLAELRTELKELEDTVETARKDVADDELTARMEPGESLYGLTLVQSHRKYVAEDDASVVMRAVREGVDYTAFTEVNASKLAEVAPDLAEIGKHEYTYLR